MLLESARTPLAPPVSVAGEAPVSPDATIVPSTSVNTILFPSAPAAVAVIVIVLLVPATAVRGPASTCQKLPTFI